MPISITRVYTRTGDKGETALVGGKRVPKDSPRIVAYGSVDELNAVVGLVRVFNAERLSEGERHRWLDEVLRKIQNQLFDLGSELATPPEAVSRGTSGFSFPKTFSAANARGFWCRDCSARARNGHASTGM